jgi:hypothetical protein
MKLKTIQDYETAVAEFDRLWETSPQGDVSARMAALISAIQEWEEINAHAHSM